jgi:hypothetical protein
MVVAQLVESKHSRQAEMVPHTTESPCTALAFHHERKDMLDTRKKVQQTALLHVS